MRFSCFCVCHYQKTFPSVLLLPCVVPSWVTSSFLALSFLQIHETHCPKSLLLQERRLHSSLHFHNASWPQLLSPQRNKKRSLGAGCATLFGFLSQSRRRRGTAGSGRGKVLQNSWWQARIQRRRSERKGLEIKTDSKSLGLRLASVQCSWECVFWDPDLHFLKETMTNCDVMLKRYKKRVGNLFTSISCCVLCPCKAYALIIQVLCSSTGSKALFVSLWKSVPRTEVSLVMVSWQRGNLWELMSLLRKPIWRDPFIYHEINL